MRQCMMRFTNFIVSAFFKVRDGAQRSEWPREEGGVRDCVADSGFQKRCEARKRMPKVVGEINAGAPRAQIRWTCCQWELRR